MIWTALVTFLGDLLGLPQWARDLSPLEHVALVPSEELEAVPLAVMGSAAAMLVVAGLLLLRRRDLVAG